MRIFLIYFFVVIATTNLIGQKRLKPEIINLTNQIKKDYPKNKFASINTTVEYNYKIGKKTIECEEFVKEKIISLKEDITFYKNIFFDEKSHISSVKATNYKGFNKIISVVKNKYKSDGVFYDDASVASFNYNLTTRGDNFKYSYTKHYNDVKYATKIFFHNYYPIEESKIIFNIPNWINIEIIECNFDGYSVEKSEEFNKKKKVNVITYSLKKLKPIVGGRYSKSMSQELPHLLILYKSYIKNGLSYNILSSTKDLYNWYSSLLKEVDDNPSVFKSKVDELVSGAETDEEKIKNIFYWVQDNVRYIAYEDGIMGFKPANAADVYTNRFGDCKGMANLTYNMLKEAGYDAHLTWIGTRSIPYSYNKTPSLAVDNHMITTLYLNDKKYFLDATEKGIALGEYAYRIQGQDVLIENGDSFIIDTVPEYDDNYNLLKTVYNLNIEDDVLVGNAYEEYNGEEQTRLYRNMGDVAKSEIFKKVNKYVAHYDKNNTISNMHISNYNDRSEPIRFEYNINIKNRITALENELYFNLDLDHIYNSFTTKENRNLGYDFQQKVHNEYEVNLTLPDGYTVDYLPESLNIDNDEFSFNVFYKYEENQKKIIYHRSIIIKEGVVSKANFEKWNTALKKLKDIYDDQLVLIIK